MTLKNKSQKYPVTKYENGKIAQLAMDSLRLPCFICLFPLCRFILLFYKSFVVLQCESA